MMECLWPATDFQLYVCNYSPRRSDSFVGYRLSLAELREEIREPDFVGQLIRESLLNNPHRVQVVMKPSQEYAKEMLAQERSRLNKLKDSMSDKDIQAVIDQTVASETSGN